MVALNDCVCQHVGYCDGSCQHPEPVAYRYRWRIDGEWTSWRVSDASQKSKHLRDLEEIPLYLSSLPQAGVSEEIIAPAECDPSCDDPECPYSHQPLTLRQAYENAVSRLRAAEHDLSAARSALCSRVDAARSPVTAEMVNAAWNKGKDLRMTGLPSDFRRVLEAALSLGQQEEAAVCQACNGKGMIGALMPWGDGQVDSVCEPCPDCSPVQAALSSQQEEAAPVAWPLELAKQAMVEASGLSPLWGEAAAMKGAFACITEYLRASRQLDANPDPFASPVPADAGEPKTVADKIIGEIEERFPNWRGYRDLIDCIDCTLHDLRSGMHPPAEDVEALAYTVANAKLGEGPSVRCEGPTDFEKDQARDWVMRVLAAIRYRSALVPATSQAKGGALPDDLFSHKAAWRRGFERLRNAASDEQDWSYWQHELDAFDRVYAALVPATSQAKGGATVDALADFLCSEFDADFNPVVGAVWPEHPDDDGYRGDRAYVRLQPTDVQAHARDNARRILTFLGQRSLRSSSPVGQETAKEGE